MKRRAEDRIDRHCYKPAIWQKTKEKIVQKMKFSGMHNFLGQFYFMQFFVLH